MSTQPFLGLGMFEALTPFVKKGFVYVNLTKIEIGRLSRILLHD